MIYCRFCISCSLRAADHESFMTIYHASCFVQAVLVDMEEGVVNEIMKSPLRDVFDHKQLISDVSGSGNNWYELFRHV